MFGNDTGCFGDRRFGITYRLSAPAERCSWSNSERCNVSESRSFTMQVGCAYTRFTFDWACSCDNDRLNPQLWGDQGTSSDELDLYFWLAAISLAAGQGLLCRPNRLERNLQFTDIKLWRNTINPKTMLTSSSSLALNLMQTPQLTILPEFKF